MFMFKKLPSSSRRGDGTPALELRVWIESIWIIHLITTIAIYVLHAVAGKWGDGAMVPWLDMNPVKRKLEVDEFEVIALFSLLLHARPSHVSLKRFLTPRGSESVSTRAIPSLFSSCHLTPNSSTHASHSTQRLHTP